MSENIKEAADQAYATIVTELAAPHFFEKIAAAGFTPSSAAEAEDAWAIAAKLHLLYTAEREKAAAANASTLSAANQQLDSVLTAAGFGGAVEKTAAFNNMANAAASRPEIAQAVLTLQAAIAVAAQQAS